MKPEVDIIIVKLGTGSDY